MKNLWLALCLSPVLCGCLQKEISNAPLVAPVEEPLQPAVTAIGIAKWYKGYASAYSPTYDHANYDGPEIAWLIHQGLGVDFEVATELFDKYPSKMDSLKYLSSLGFGYFGHGHTHVDHDALSYSEALASFRTNFEHMTKGGLKPVSYAYPGGWGFEPETRQALKDAGFLSARMAWHDYDLKRLPYVLQDEETNPPDWFMLPALYMQSFDFNGCWSCIKNDQEFSRFLYESMDHGAWLLSVYHGIGQDGIDRPVSWGFYKLSEFYADMLLAKSLRDEGKLWIASISTVTLYVMERNATTLSLNSRGKSEFDLHVNNALDKEMFDQPLTVRLGFAEKTFGKHLLITLDGPGGIQLDTLITAGEMWVDLVPSDHPYRLVLR